MKSTYVVAIRKSAATTDQILLQQIEFAECNNQTPGTRKLTQKRRQTQHSINPQSSPIQNADNTESLLD